MARRPAFDPGLDLWHNGGLPLPRRPHHNQLLVEFRDHIHTEQSFTTHFWGVRFGVTFR